MKNKKAEEVIKRIREETEVFTIKLVGNSEDKSSGFYIMMTTQALYSTKKGTYHGIKKSTLRLLDEANIKYKILK